MMDGASDPKFTVAGMPGQERGFAIHDDALVIEASDSLCFSRACEN